MDKYDLLNNKGVLKRLNVKSLEAAKRYVKTHKLNDCQPLGAIYITKRGTRAAYAYVKFRKVGDKIIFGKKQRFVMIF